MKLSSITAVFLLMWFSLPGLSAPADSVPDKALVLVSKLPRCAQGFVDKQGRIFKFIGTNRPKFAEGLAEVQISKKCGFMDNTGKIVISPAFDECSPFSEGLASVRVGDSFGFINQTGKMVITPRFDFAQAFSDGMAAINMENKWGFIDHAGKTTIEPKFQMVRPFHDGWAAVAMDGRWGWIDKTGEFVIKPQFLLSNDFHNGKALVDSGSNCAYVDKTGQVEKLPYCSAPYPGTFSNGGTIAYKVHRGNRTYEVLVPYHRGIYRLRNPADNMAASVSSSDGSFDFSRERDFQEAISRQQDGLPLDKRVKLCDQYHSGLAVASEGTVPDVTRNNRCFHAPNIGFVDTAGNFVIPPTFNGAKNFSEGFAPVEVEGRWGFIDKQGQFLVPPTFEEAEPFSEGLAYVRSGDEQSDQSGTSQTTGHPAK